jgi:Spy/CpxP family protein refolding chaperone
MKLLAISIFASALVLAQGPPPRRGPGGGGPRGMEQMLTQHLNLNAEQQNRMHTAFEEARTASRGLDTQMQSLHTQLTEAVKSGNEGAIDAITQQMSQLHQQQTAIHAKSAAKIYQSLTADQKSKLGDNLGMLMGPGGGMGMGMGGPRGRFGGANNNGAPKPQAQ